MAPGAQAVFATARRAGGGEPGWRQSMIEKEDTVGRSDGRERPSRLMDLADNRGGTDPDLERVGALLGKVAPPAGLTAVQLLRVRERLDQSTRPTVAQGRRTRFSILVLAGLTVLLDSGVVAAA